MNSALPLLIFLLRFFHFLFAHSCFISIFLFQLLFHFFIVHHEIIENTVLLLIIDLFFGHFNLVDFTYIRSSDILFFRKLALVPAASNMHFVVDFIDLGPQFLLLHLLYLLDFSYEFVWCSIKTSHHAISVAILSWLLGHFAIKAHYGRRAATAHNLPLILYRIVVVGRFCPFLLGYPFLPQVELLHSFIVIFLPISIVLQLILLGFVHCVAQPICTFIFGVPSYQFFSFEVFFTKKLFFGRSSQNVTDSVFFELCIQFLVLTHFFETLVLLGVFFNF